MVASGRATSPAWTAASDTIRARSGVPVRKYGCAYRSTWSSESVAIRPARAASATGHSCRPVSFGPTVVTWLPGRTQSASMTGVPLFVASTTRSASSTASRASPTGDAARSSSARQRCANRSRRPRSRLCTRTSRSDRTARSAQSWLHAWVPVPTSPTVAAAGSASRSTATAPIAPVRAAPSQVPPAAPSTSPVRSSKTTVTWSAPVVGIVS